MQPGKLNNQLFIPASLGLGFMGSPEVRVFVAHSQVSPSIDKELDGSFVHLRNPKSGTRACYLLLDGVVQEIHWFKPRFASWFIGDSVCEDGSLYFGSVIDPLFMILPILEESRMKKGDESGMFRSLEEMMYVEGYPCYARLLPLLSKLLDAICEIREVGGSTFYRLDDLKVLGWLCCKVKQTSEALKLYGGSAFTNLGEVDLKVYTVGLLGEYLKADPWLQRLCEHLSVDLEASKKSKGFGAHPANFVPLQPSTASKQNVASNKKAKKGGPQPGTSKITSFFARPR